MRFPNPFLFPALAMNEVPAVDASGGAPADDASGAELEGEVPALEDEPAPEGDEEPSDEEGAPRRTPPRDDGGKFRSATTKEKEHAPATKQKFTLKTKSGVREVELTAEEIAARLTRDEESYSRFEQAAAERKAAQAEREQAAAIQKKVDTLIADPRALRAFLREKGGDKAHDLLVHALKEELQERMRDPRDVELERLRRAESERTEAAEREAAERGQREAAEALKAQVEQMRPQMEKQVWGALEKVGLPGDERLARVVAYHYLAAKQEGIELSMDELARVASDELDKDLSVRTKGLTGAQVKQRYPDLYRAVHADLVAQLKGRRPEGSNTATGAGPDPLRSEAPRPASPPTKRILSPKEWRSL